MGVSVPYRTLMILEGPSPEPDDQRVLLVSSDPGLLEAVREALNDRLQAGRLDADDARQMLRLLEEGEEGEQ